MSLNINDSLLLLAKAKEENLYKKLVAQLRKDFVLANIDLNLNSETIEMNALAKILHEKIYFLILEKFTEYLNLLYVIDVPEHAFKNIKVTDAVEVSEQVTVLVFQRELQKVRLKTKFS